MTAYPFLVLCGLTCIPALLVGILRRDLRIHMARVAALSLPFALTEFLFYPDYWDPPFLFDAARTLGFGIEDFLFVAALGATAIGVYPAVSRKRFLAYPPGGGRPPFLITAGLISSALLLALISWLAGIPAICSAPVIMLALSSAILLTCRRDLWRDAFKGGVVTVGTYSAICLAFEGLLPGAFDRYWHTTGLLNAFAGPVPLEELIYGFAAGFSVAVVYPFAFGLAFSQDAACSIPS
jgi:hypothetical protein